MISGPDGLPLARKGLSCFKGKIACQETGSHVQAHGMACRGVRGIWRRTDFLKPSLQKVQPDTHRKGACYRCRPLRRSLSESAAILRGAGAMPSEGIEGGGRDA